ncbi:zinc-binding dehydrogenase [Rhodococcus triatomae]|uniref:zinc-binding dehydrogenase n=1 Tax=Rhodococcus triatomae TaxID=300028 RepID=UPI001C315AE9|nr:zinc-binding dehydrogenase [Rhodococcus triatomae]
MLNWVTALAALKPLGGTRAGEVVRVHAAAGGVGQAAVRLASHYCAQIVATASPSKHHVLHALGAGHVLDSRRPDLADEIARTAGGVDLVLESVGRATFRTSLVVTRPFTGRIVVFGGASGETTVSTHDLAFSHQVQIKGLHIGALATDAPSIYQGLLLELEALVAAGVCPPGTPEVHPLADGPNAAGTTRCRRHPRQTRPRPVALKRDRPGRNRASMSAKAKGGDRLAEPFAALIPEPTSSYVKSSSMRNGWS